METILNVMESKESVQMALEPIVLRSGNCWKLEVLHANNILKLIHLIYILSAQDIYGLDNGILRRGIESLL